MSGWLVAAIVVAGLLVLAVGVGRLLRRQSKPPHGHMTLAADMNALTRGLPEGARVRVDVPPVVARRPSVAAARRSPSSPSRPVDGTSPGSWGASSVAGYSGSDCGPSTSNGGSYGSGGGYSGSSDSGGSSSSGGCDSGGGGSY